MAKIGLLVGREWSFPPRFLEEVNRRNAGVTAASRPQRRCLAPWFALGAGRRPQVEQLSRQIERLHIDAARGHLRDQAGIRLGLDRV